jgi:ABC-type antimicrobial peptide transport system permease subunit
MNLRQKRRVLWGVVIVGFLFTWFPNLGLLNTLTWIGPITLPLAWVLFLNMILTVCVLIVYPLYYKPFFKKLKENPIETEGVE